MFCFLYLTYLLKTLRPQLYDLSVPKRVRVHVNVSLIQRLQKARQSLYQLSSSLASRHVCLQATYLSDGFHVRLARDHSDLVRLTLFSSTPETAQRHRRTPSFPGLAPDLKPIRGAPVLPVGLTTCGFSVAGHVSDAPSTNLFHMLQLIR